MTTFLLLAADNPTLLYWGLILFGVAAALLFIELFVPSGGLIGLVAGVALIGSLVAFFRYDTKVGTVVLLAYIILGPILAVFIFKVWLNSPLARRLILGGEMESNDPDDAGRSEYERRQRLAELQTLVGAEGVAVTTCRPVGVVRVQGERIDAMADLGVIEAGTPIVITEVADNQVKIRAK